MRLPELALDELDDPRQRRGRRWTLPTLLTAVLAGLVAGCKDLAAVEALTAEMSGAMRRWLGLSRRIADTTLRDVLCKLEPDALRTRLHALCKRAHRRKALTPVGLPFGVVALDGKATAVRCAPGRFAQSQSDDAARCLVRTVSCTLVSSAAKVCLDAIPIPATTNEMGHFAYVLDALCAAYANTSLFRVVSYDAGACSEANARHVKAHDLDYLFALKGTQPTLRAEAERLLAARSAAEAEAVTNEARGAGTWIRRVYTTDEMAGYLEWDHLATVVRVESERRDAQGIVIAYENRYFVASLARDALTAAQWLHLVRVHWGVENEGHHTWDTAFAEDDKPWIEADEQGVLAVMLLRRMAYTLLALFRSVTQRSDERRRMPWKDLLRGIYNTLIAATAAQLAGLRPRPEATVTA